MGIVVLGAVFVDIKGYPIGSFIPAGRNKGNVKHIHGGVSRNVVEDIANLELRPTYVSLIDDSGMGEDVLNKLKNHKINTSYIQTTPNGMGTWLAIFDKSGDVYASISNRPDLSPIERMIDQKGDEIFSQCDSIVLEIDMEASTVKKVFRYAKKYGKKVYALVSNMSIAVERRDLILATDCFICNQQEAGILFAEDYTGNTPEKMCEALAQKVKQANIHSMVVTMGAAGSVYATQAGERGICPAQKVRVKDTTGAGDAFFAGVAAGLTYGKSIEEACKIGTKLAASVICTSENVCPRFLPSEFGLPEQPDE